MAKNISLPEESIFKKIVLLRDQKVLLDSDLAELYGVPTKVLKQAVRRNLDRFPDDFMFELTIDELRFLRSQIVTLETGRGKYSKYKPFAFTEQGVAMLSSVLNSPQAIAVNIQIMRVFVKMRQLITSYKGLLDKIEKLEANDSEKNKHIKNIYNIIKELLEPALKKRKPIGFNIGKSKAN
jgi:hypothetical protein